MSQFHDIPSFVEAAVDAIGRAASNVRLNETKEGRVLRRFSLSEASEIMGCDRSYLYTLLKHPSAPEGEVRGREKTLSVEDIMRLRALSCGRPGSRRKDLHWRGSDDPLPVIVVSCQKGGTAKSMTCAHLAQYAALFYGLRVGVIDCDPQATASLYFVDDETSIASYETETFTDFMGVPDPGITVKIRHDPERLDTFWRRTPWPGLRLIPGGASIQEADIAMYYLTQTDNQEQKRVYRMLRDALGRWSEAFPPRTRPEDLFDEAGLMREDVYERALTETLDLIVIDTPPSLSLAALNTVVAGDMLVIPQTMKGFDLSTLHIYLSSLNDYFRFIRRDTDPVRFATSRPFILPTIVARNSDTDLRTIGEIHAISPEIISPVFYGQSDGASNAFREYKSAYEYQPDRSRRESMKRFVDNANAVNDAILTRAVPSLPSRGFANAFIRETYPEGTIPMWSKTDDGERTNHLESVA